MTKPSLHVPWSCAACREGGRFPRLYDTTLTTIREAIERGHERRAPECHALRGTRRILFVLDGIAYRFDSTPQPRGAHATDP